MSVSSIAAILCVLRKISW